MNFDVLRGRPMRILWPQRDHALRKSGVGNVFIKHLEKNIDNKALYDTFSAFGNILSCKIMTDENGRSKGFGFVHFETQEAANEAIRSVNGMLLGDRKVFVGSFIGCSQRIDAQGPTKFTNVLIKNFDDHLDEEKLRELLSKYGKIVALRIAYDEDGQSKGSGFCSFENPEEAEAAVQHLNGYPIGDKQLFVRRFQKKAERMAEIKREKDPLRLERLNKYQGLYLYIKNLDANIDDERLKKEFSKFGTVTSARVSFILSMFVCSLIHCFYFLQVMTENGQSKGFGFVRFSTPDEATNAVMEMNGSLLESKPLYVILAQRKEERRMHLRSQLTTRAFPRTTAVLNQSPLTPAVLANARPEDQKQMLGERLFPFIKQMQPEWAGRITGMLLEIDNTELSHMLESLESLKSKVCLSEKKGDLLLERNFI